MNSESFGLCGLGNALLDTLYQVDDAFLTEAKIDKGVMTLVDQKQHRKMIKMLKSQKNIGCASGGSVANSVMLHQLLGGQSAFCCNLAADEVGDHYLNDMQQAGVYTRYDHKHREQGQSGQCLVMITPDADRTMMSYLGISDQLDCVHLDKSVISKSSYFFIEGYLTTSQTAMKAVAQGLEWARSSGANVALSLSDPFVVTHFKENFLKILKKPVDLLFSNIEEALSLTGANTLDEAVVELKQYANTFAVTLGEQGSCVFDGQELYKVDPLQVTAIDTVGAGDMYAGGFLYGLSSGMGYAKAAQLANLASSQVVSKWGPRLTYKEAQAILQRMPNEVF